MTELITIENQNNIKLQGATRVISSTQTQACVEAGDSTILITGNDLEVKKLDLDNKSVEFSGKISTLKFTTKAEKVPLMKRIFK